MEIKCIALDLDRTTLDSQGHLSEENRTAIGRAASAGVHVVVASGRSLDSLPAEITEIPGVRYAITSNGAAVYDLCERKCLRQFKMTPESVEDILRHTEQGRMKIEYLEETEISYEAFIDGRAFAESRYVADPVRFGAMPQAIPYIQSTRRPIEDMRTFIREHKSELDCVDLVVKSEEMKNKLWKNLRENVSDVYITSSVKQLLEISHRDAGKESGAKFLLEYLGLTREELAAFGDGDNDSGLLKYAGIGFAVANASPECREAADEIVASNDEYGVAQGINKILAM
ncbi:MAG TPA: Cof-type HAD-IIB family hydrolase [Candidatus Mediterraneibacter gallistercoris]|uniref:Cof-type HAD-IIB family hydrolase n=1 Tax=Candidatus Mediterraneibacter gallistercoris TaxID=2838671 RepID=A0A9D2T0R3_9FIRM|nr:Cof-type HAD-IIB family hydrolase [Candidatus Mediterraneibacter gallistercoris]